MQQQAAAEKTVTKVCSQCGRELPIEDFYQHKNAKDGYSTMCKECHKKRMKAQNEERKRLLEIARSGGKQLKDYSPRELMQSLQKRGFYGILHYDTEVEKEIVVDGHKGTFRYKETKDIDITNF